MEDRVNLSSYKMNLMKVAQERFSKVNDFRLHIVWLEVILI